MHRNPEPCTNASLPPEPAPKPTCTTLALSVYNVYHMEVYNVYYVAQVVRLSNRQIGTAGHS
jgi:hypothetical protein